MLRNPKLFGSDVEPLETKRHGGNPEAPAPPLDAVHLLTGLLGMVAGYYAGGKFARQYAIGRGAVYLLVAVAGVVLFDLLRRLIALNVADNFLHMLLAVVLLGVGLVFRGQQTP